jgi:hypothetical protein
LRRPKLSIIKGSSAPRRRRRRRRRRIRRRRRRRRRRRNGQGKTCRNSKYIIWKGMLWVNKT